MALYRVRPGFTHGARSQYNAGDTMEYTPEEAAGFADKLELVEVAPVPTPAQPAPAIVEQSAEETPTAFDVTGSTVAAVLAAIDRGLISAADALAVEIGNRNRATLVKALQELIGVSTGE